MEIDHGGLEPPMAKTKSDSPTNTTIALTVAESDTTRELKEILEQARETAQQFAIQLKNMRAANENKALQSHHNERTLSIKAESIKVQTTTNPRPRKRSKHMHQKLLGGEQTATTKSPPLSHGKISLIAGSTAKFPDPKNCIDFLQQRQETLPCWFPKRSGRNHLKTMTQHELLARASMRPQKFHCEATAAT